jgi:hypothetical protein
LNAWAAIRLQHESAIAYQGARHMARDDRKAVADAIATVRNKRDQGLALHIVRGQEGADHRRRCPFQFEAHAIGGSLPSSLSSVIG